MAPKPWTELRVACLIHRETQSLAVLSIPRFTPSRWFECDVMIVTRAGLWHEFEIKLSFADFRADRKKKLKHAILSGRTSRLAGHEGPNRFWYVVPEEISAAVWAELPAWSGLAIVKRYGNGHGWLHRVVRAPRLHAVPATARMIDQANRAMPWRMWNALTRLADGDGPWLWTSPDEEEGDTDALPPVLNA